RREPLVIANGEGLRQVFAQGLDRFQFQGAGLLPALLRWVFGCQRDDFHQGQFWTSPRWVDTQLTVYTHPRRSSMARTRRTYTPEFKTEAVKLVTEQDYSVAEAARSLGLNENLIRSWKQALQDQGEHA